MSRLIWDATGQHYYETGVEKGVLYPMSGSSYGAGVAWNGLTALTEKPTGGDKTDLWADNIKYLSLRANESFEGTIEAYTYPDEFMECNGEKEVVGGMTIGQQGRKSFGLCYRTSVGNDTDGNDHGYKLHLVYGASVSPSERGYETVNDTPSAINFSWDFATVPTSDVPTGAKPTALVVLDSETVGAEKMAIIEDYLYGKDASGGATAITPTLLTPTELYNYIKDGTLPVRS